VDGSGDLWLARSGFGADAERRRGGVGASSAAAARSGRGAPPQGPGWTPRMICFQNCKRVRITRCD